MSSQSTVLNGIDRAELQNTIEQVQQNPKIGFFKFRAHNQWIQGAHCKTTIKDFYGVEQENNERSQIFHIDADEPKELLGTDEGANATEALLHALASCLNATFIYTATLKQIPIETLEFEMEGELDLRGFLGLSNEVRNGFNQIQVICKIKSSAPKERLVALCKTAQLRSPVFDCVSNPVPINVELEML